MFPSNFLFEQYFLKKKLSQTNRNLFNSLKLLQKTINLNDEKENKKKHV